ncbi:MAG TPA: O-antigen ligase family protein, partial [Rhodospirillales bacterium]|nr:O-antigen ligase family protein [Rhodospirillales bacterium]
MRGIHKGHVLGVSAFLAIPFAIFMSKAMALLFVIAAVLGLAADWARERTLPTLSKPFSILFALIAAYGLTSTLWSISPDNSLGLTLPLAGTFLGGLVLVSLGSRLHEDERPFFEAALIIGVVTGFALLAFEMFSPLVLTRFLNKVVMNREIIVNYTQQNYYKTGATVAVLMAWPALATLWRRGSKVGSMALLVVVIATILASGSGASILGFFVGLTVFAMAYLLRRRAAAIFTVMIVFAVAAMPLAPRLLPSPQSIEDSMPYLPNSVFPRIFIWKSASGYIAETPILGKGLDSSRAISTIEDKVFFAPNIKHNPQSEPIPLHPHSAIL